MNPLTKRQLEVCRYYVEGYTNAQIARAMKISAQTVRNHGTRINRALGTSDRTQVVIELFRQGKVW